MTFSLRFHQGSSLQSPQLPLLLFASIFVPSLSHVVLTFPPARFPPLDFLDKARTDPPCGVPKPSGKWYSATTLTPGSQINVTWKMAYAHQGAYRIDLLDPEGNVLQVLTQSPDGAGNGFLGMNDQTLTHQMVTLPTRECRNCAIRLMRQAQEWGNYAFWTCSDVDLVQDLRNGPLNGCFGNGDLVANGNEPKCVCRGPFIGQYCHLKEDCVRDADCGNYGSCVQSESNSEQKNRCYCQSPYFGRNCEKKFDPGQGPYDPCFKYDFQNSAALDAVINQSCYQRVDFRGEADKMFYRVVNGNEIEVVLSFQSNTWISVGWRPTGTKPSCYNFPVPKSENAPTNPHPMDCTDIVVGSVHGDRLSHVGDYYTRDRSTPLRDQEYGGSDSLTAAAGYRIGGQTVVMFRKPLQAYEKTDHSISNGKMFVIWAKGMEPGQYSFNVPSAIDTGSVSDPEYYKPNDLMYHGNRNRGVSIVNFLEGSGVVGPSVDVLRGNSVHAEPEPRPEGYPHAEGEPEPEGEYRSPVGRPYPEGEPKPGSHSEPEPGSYGEPNAEGEPKSEPNTLGRARAEPEPNSEGEPRGGSSNSVPTVSLIFTVFISLSIFL